MISRCITIGFLWMVACSAAIAQECPYFILNRVPIGQFNQPVVESSITVNSKKELDTKIIAKKTRDMDTSYRSTVRKHCMIGVDSIFILPGQLKWCLPARHYNIESKYQPSKLSNMEPYILRRYGGPQIDSIRMIRTNKKFFNIKNYAKNLFLLSCVVFYDPSGEEGKDVVEDYTNIFSNYIDYMAPRDSSIDAVKRKKFQGFFIRFIRKYPQSAYGPSLLQFLDLTLVRCVRGKDRDFLFEAFKYLLNQRSIYGHDFIKFLSESIHYTQKQWKLGDEEMESLFSGEPNAYDYYFKTPVHNALAKLQKK